jgi:restriction system protein
MAAAWKEYQEEAASFFRSLGLDASTDVTVKGVRTTHDIDVLVKSEYVGFEIVWIVECKCWKTPVSKSHVLALREIVTDTGADRGILLSESGFQSGAIEAANLTNVQVTSLEEVSVTARSDFFSMRFRELYDRIEECRDRYWNISKYERIDNGLRPEVGDGGYSGAGVVDTCIDILTRAFRGVYPFECGALISRATPELPEQFTSPEEVYITVEPMVVELENKLNAYESSR